MKHREIHTKIETLSSLKTGKMYQDDFLLTWDKTEDELRAVLIVAEILKMMRKENIAPRIFDSGLAVAIFRDKSTRTRFSFMSAANLLGLAAQDLDETKTQIAHGETVRETANMISFLTEVIGIRDDMFLGYGHTYMTEVSEAVREGHREGVLPQIPTLVNLQCDRDHPTQSLSDILHLIHHFGSLEALRDKTIAMTWAYSPSYGKPLSVPQGVIALMSRFGMKVNLAYPEGYSLIPEIEETAENNSRAAGGSFHRFHSMVEAFSGADVVYPKSWAPYEVMQRRTALLKAGDSRGLDELEAECLKINRQYIDWECSEELMDRTNEALYLHCLPADISAVSCERGEVAASVFERFRLATYRQAGYKPYIIAAMMLLSKVERPPEVLARLLQEKTLRANLY
ncbi:MAG: knotted carbamoyltransferase YgeW [Spirochaetaceae bacterium]|nr:MAG: knotted carbamoyltransferase YgeW [Spirochaetaceae bacterium]